MLTFNIQMWSMSTHVVTRELAAGKELRTVKVNIAEIDATRGRTKEPLLGDSHALAKSSRPPWPS